jgi:hypothetical protein
MSMELEALDHVGLTVTDVARSVRWYHTRCSASAAPTRRRGATSRRCRRPTAVARAIYMPDPEGHLVKITTDEVTRG